MSKIFFLKKPIVIETSSLNQQDESNNYIFINPETKIRIPQYNLIQYIYTDEANFDKNQLISNFSSSLPILYKYGLNFSTQKILILPFIKNKETNLIEKVGLLTNYNPFRHKQYMTNLLIFEISVRNAFSIEQLKKYLEKYSNMLIEDDDKWIFLGHLYSNENVDLIYKLYAVDCSQFRNSVDDDEKLKLENHNKDKKDENEVKEFFNFYDIHNMKQSSESLLLASYYKLLNYNLGQLIE